MALKYFLFSIRPVYARAVLSGVKRWELRRGSLESMSMGDAVVLYVSGNEQRITGMFRAGRIYRGSPHQVWRLVSGDPLSGVDRSAWQFIAGSPQAVAIEVLDPCTFRKRPSLGEVRQIFPAWNPPLSHVELSRDEPLFLLFLKDLVEECESRGSRP